MKKFHILLLICIAICISILISFTGSLTSFETIQSAKKQPGKYLNIIASLDPSKPIEYDPLINPNYLSFSVHDSLGDVLKVVYKNAKPENFESSDRLVLKGTFKDDYFDCKEILMKCPSKYKEDIQSNENQLPEINNTYLKSKYQLIQKDI